MIRKKPILEKKSPLQSPPLPNPGDSLFAELVEIALAQRLSWAIVAVAACMIAALEWLRWYRPTPPVPVGATIIAGVVLIGVVIVWRRTEQKIKNIRLGMLGEMAVGQQLERLRSDGFEVLHDIAEDGFNIDHVLIGPPGVFAVETKTLSKVDGVRGLRNEVTWDGKQVRVNGHIPDRDPIVQVRAGSKRISEILMRRCGKKISVRSVVLYPGWWVEAQFKGDPWVLNPQMLPGFLRNEPACLSQSEITKFTSELENHVRSKSLT